MQNNIKSKVTLSPFEAKHYDTLLNVLTLGIYGPLIERIISKIEFLPEESILDLGSGTGRFCIIFHKKANKIKTYVGLDQSKIMVLQAREKCKKFKNTKFIVSDIREAVPFKEEFTKVFISFVLHGFTQNEREKIIKNAYNSLKENGEFIILDYGEKDVDKLPFFEKLLIRKLECPLAEEFMSRSLKEMLKKEGFREFKEYLFLNGFIRLEVAKK